ncbi:MAG: LEA type 2 family protein, partial [Myxococcota bacterium]
KLPVTLNFIELGSTLIEIFRERETLNYSMNVTTTVTSPSGPQTAQASGEGLLALPRLPKVAGGDAQVSGLDLFGAALTFELTVENPNPFPIRLGEMAYGLTVNGKSLIAGKEAGQELAATGTSSIRLPLQVNFAEVAVSMVEFLSKNEKVDYGLHADFGFPTSAGDISMPLDIAGDLALPRLPKMALAGVSLVNSSLTGATLRFDMRVSNRSGFPIELKGLSYDIALANQRVSQGRAQTQTLAAKGESVVPIVVRLSYLDLGASVVKMIKRREAPYRVRGALDFGLFKQDFDLSGSAKL